MGRWVKKFSKQFRHGEKGFTLIELLVVVAILGVLAAIAIPNVSKFIGTGTDQAAATELHDIQTAVTAAMADSGIYPIPSAPLTLSSTSNPDVGGGHLVGSYILGGHTVLTRSYNIASDGTVTRVP